MTTSRRNVLGFISILAVAASGGAALAQAQVAVAKVSGLPTLPGADLWVDVEGRPTVVIPGVPPRAIEKMQVLVFRPRSNSVGLDQYLVPFVELGWLGASQQPVLNSVDQPRGEGQNREETFLFKSARPNELLAIGFIRNLRTNNQLVYAVALQGNLNPASALQQAKVMVASLAEKARSQRLTPPPPQGAVSSGPTNRFTGAALAQLQRGIQTNANAGPRVRQMAGVVIPQASSVTLSTWRMPAPMTDEAFVDYYTGQANRLGWGPAVSRDVSVPGRPTLLFQIPDGAGVVMVRAQTGPNAAGRAVTSLIALVIEGRIDVSAIAGK